MPARTHRPVSLAASVLALAALGLTGCTDDGDGAAGSSTAATGSTATDAPVVTTAPPSTEPTGTPAPTLPEQAGLALEVGVDGPYESAAGAALRLDARVAIEGQSDTVADLGAIGSALRAYADEHGSYPPAFLTDAAGTPTVSWRVLLLPHLGETELYERFDLSQPWDAPVNAPLIAEIPDVFRDGESDGTGDTAYAGVAGSKHVFRAGAGELGGGVAPGFVVDGDTMTIAVGPVGADVAIPWTAPGDIDTTEHPLLGDPTGFDGPADLVTPLLFLDGTVLTYPDDLDEGSLLSWSTIAGDSCNPPASLDVDLNAAWDFDADGTPDAYGLSVDFPIDEPGEHPVDLTIDDGLGGIHTLSATVTVA